MECQVFRSYLYHMYKETLRCHYIIENQLGGFLSRENKVDFYLQKQLKSFPVNSTLQGCGKFRKSNKKHF